MQQILPFVCVGPFYHRSPLLRDPYHRASGSQRFNRDDTRYLRKAITATHITAIENSGHLRREGDWSSLTAYILGAIDASGNNQRSIRFAGRGFDDSHFATLRQLAIDQGRKASLTAALPANDLRKTWFDGYVQDDHRATANLILDLGVRYTVFDLFQEAHGKTNPFDFDTCGPHDACRLGNSARDTVRAPSSLLMP